VLCFPGQTALVRSTPRPPPRPRDPRRFTVENLTVTRAFCVALSAQLLAPNRARAVRTDCRFWRDIANGPPRQIGSYGVHEKREKNALPVHNHWKPASQIIATNGGSMDDVVTCATTGGKAR
jgi:hypothetical protein